MAVQDLTTGTHLQNALLTSPYDGSVAYLYFTPSVPPLGWRDYDVTMVPLQDPADALEYSGSSSATPTIDLLRSLHYRPDLLTVSCLDQPVLEQQPPLSGAGLPSFNVTFGSDGSLASIAGLSSAQTFELWDDVGDP
jgi:hypothetical protein